MKRRERDTIDTAYHEAGHAVAAWALGFELASVWITGETAAVGRRVGRTQLTVESLLPRLYDEANHVHALAGDAVDAHREVHMGGHVLEVYDAVHMGGHVLEVYDAVGEARFDELWSEAKALVEQNWSAIDRFADVLLARREIYTDDLRVLATELGYSAAES